MNGSTSRATALLILPLLWLLSCLAVANAATPLVATYRNDNLRTGEYFDAFLEPSTVGFHKFGKVWEYPVKGYIYAQPLLVSNVSVGTGTRNLVLVATASNYLYAFDADRASPTPVWMLDPHTFGNPMNVTNCSFQGSQFSFGILGTPVVDSSGSSLYVVAESGSGCNGFIHTLFRIEVASGRVLNRIKISANVSGVSFDSTRHIQRPGLTLAGGRLLVAFGSINDQKPFFGWVLAYDAATLTPVGQYCTNCAAGSASAGAAIWQGGNAIAVDSSSNAYVMTGNDAGTAGSLTLGDRFLKLNAGLALAGSFRPIQPSVGDLDLGSSGPVLIPGTQLLVGAGKEGKLFLLDAATMSPLDSTLMSNQFLPGQPGRLDEYPHVHGAPVFRRATKDLYVWAEKDYLRRVHVDVVNRSLAPVMQSTAPVFPNDMPGGFLALSVNTRNTNPATNTIVWAVVRSQRTEDGTMESSGPDTLRAIDATTLKEIWRADRTFAGSKFPTLAIGYGRVYVSTFENKLLVFGSQTCVPSAGHVCRAATVGDFDGDGKTNVAVFKVGCRPQTPGPHIYSVRGGSDTAVACADGDTPVPGDYDGNGTTDRAVWQSFPPFNWNGGGLGGIQWGAAGDIPVPADYDGDGRTDIAVWRPSVGTFLVRGATLAQPRWGTAGDIPVPADYHGTGKAQLAVWRPSDGVWYVQNGPASLFVGLAPPFSDYVPVPCDYNGDGRVDKGLWNKRNGTWLVIDALTGVVHVSNVQWGDFSTYRDVPVPGDYNGDGKCELAVWRSTTNEWFVLDGSNDGAMVGMPVSIFPVIPSASRVVPVPTAVNAGRP